VGAHLSSETVKRPIPLLVCACVAFTQSARSQAPTKPAKPNPVVQAAVEPSAVGPDSVTLRIVNTELRSAVQIMQQFLDKPVIFSGAAGGAQVSLELPRPVPRADIPRLLRVRRGHVERNVSRATQGGGASFSASDGELSAAIASRSRGTSPDCQSRALRDRAQTCAGG
jgi:hypothetical protein